MIYPSKETFLRSAIVAVCLWYILLCAAHLFSLRPLWNDEECVFHSIQSFTTKGLFTRPLFDLQVFPRLYLLAIQKISAFFDFHLAALRFLPFVAMMAAFFVWLKISRLQFQEQLQRLTFVLSWCASAVLIYYAAELKQYSMDVLTAALFLLFLYYQESLHKTGRSSYVWMLILLPALMLVSYVTAFFLIFPLCQLFILRKNDSRTYRLMVLYVLSTTTVMLLSYYFDVRLRPTDVLMQQWNDYFVSTSSFPEFFKTLGEGTNNLFSRWFVERPKILKKIGLFFVGFGFIYLWGNFFAAVKKRQFSFKSIDSLAGIIFIELFIMGVLHKYPFTVPRTSLFFCPVVLYLTIKGIWFLKEINRPLFFIIHSVYLVFLVFLISHLSGITLSGQLTFRPILW